MDKRRIRQLRATLSLACAAWALGCASHGKHTAEFKEKAEARVAQIKSATQWDMAQQQFLAGDLQKALRSVDQSVAINEKVAKSHLLRGRILIEMGRLEDAMDSLQQAAELDPAAAEPPYYLGIVHERFSQYDEALKSYQQAAKLDSTNPQYVLASAEMLIELNKLQEAQGLLEKNKSSFEHNAGIRQTLGHIESLRGRQREAAALFNEAALLAPDDLSIAEDLALAQAASGQFAEAERNLRRVLADRSKSDRRDLRHLQARCLIELDRPIEARQILIALVGDPQGPTDDAAWIALAGIAVKVNDLHRLREAAQRLVSIAPARPEGYTYLALWQRSEGKLELAAETLQRAVQLSAKDPNPAVLRGMILTDLGREEEAAESFRLALAKNPRHVQARSLLAALPDTSTERPPASIAGAEIQE